MPNINKPLVPHVNTFSMLIFSRCDIGLSRVYLCNRRFRLNNDYWQLSNFQGNAFAWESGEVIKLCWRLHDSYTFRIQKLFKSKFLNHVHVGPNPKFWRKAKAVLRMTLKKKKKKNRGMEDMVLHNVKKKKKRKHRVLILYHQPVISLYAHYAPSNL